MGERKKINFFKKLSERKFFILLFLNKLPQQRSLKDGINLKVFPRFFAKINTTAKLSLKAAD
jgi:hypothetical protein